MDSYRLFNLTAHTDERGSFTEVFRQTWTYPPSGLEVPPENDEWPQANISRSRAGVLRGMHFHKQQSDWWYVVDGKMEIALYDLRIAQAKPEMVSLGQQTALLIPPLVAHGFLALTDVTLLYLVSDYHTGKDEFGIAWDDPDMAIPWRGITDEPQFHGGPVLSERDRTNPPLREVLEMGLEPRWDWHNLGPDEDSPATHS
jgi:dTDP-4-dehydrorhamnose 3,5-epimerase